MSASGAPFARVDAGGRAAARHRVRVVTAVAAGGAVLGSGLLTIALAPATQTAFSSGVAAFSGDEDDAPGSLTGTLSGSSGLTGGSGPVVTTSGGS